MTALHQRHLPARLDVARSRHDIARKLRAFVLLTGALDLLVLALSVRLAWHVRLWLDVWSAHPSTGGEAAAAAGPYVVLAWFLVLAAQGAYSIRYFAAGPDEFRVVTMASLLTAGLTGLVCYLLELPLSRGFVLMVFSIGTPLLLGERLLVRRVAHALRRRGRLVHRVVAVGGPSGVSEVVDALRRERQVGYAVVGACVPSGVAVEPERFPVPILGGVQDARRLCDDLGADTVLVTRGGYSTARELRRIAWDLEGSSIDLVVVPSLIDVAGPRIHMRPVAGLPLLHVEEPQASEAAGFEKRLFDVVFAVVALVLLSPLLVAVAVVVKLQDGGPVLFRQARVGRGGGGFGIGKFPPRGGGGGGRGGGPRGGHEAGGGVF